MPDEQPRRGHAQIRDWLPHLMMLAMLASATWLVATVFAPLTRPLLVAAALAALTHAVVMTPTHTRLCRWFPWLDPTWRRRIAAALATALLLSMAVVPVFLVLLDALGGVQKTWDVTLGLALRDPHQAQAVADALAAHAERMRTLYPAFPITPDMVRVTVLELLQDNQARAFYGWLFRGTGGALAHAGLIILLLVALFERGEVLAQRLLHLAPFTDRQRGELTRRFQHTTLRLLHDTVAMAVLRGLVLGIVAWLLGDFPVGVVAAIAAFVGLIPVVGYASVWIPLAGIVWSRGEPVHAAGLVVACVLAGWLVGRLGVRMTRKLDTTDSWPGFLLFLGIIGGVLAFGWTGLVIGPMAVVVLKVLLGFWLPLYGVGEPEPEDAPPPGALPAEPALPLAVPAAVSSTESAAVSTATAASQPPSAPAP